MNPYKYKARPLYHKIITVQIEALEFRCGLVDLFIKNNPINHVVEARRGRGLSVYIAAFAYGIPVAY